MYLPFQCRIAKIVVCCCCIRRDLFSSASNCSRLFFSESEMTFLSCAFIDVVLLMMRERNLSNGIAIAYSFVSILASFT